MPTQWDRGNGATGEAWLGVTNEVGTGINSPSANTVTIQTGGNSGTARLTVNSTAAVFAVNTTLTNTTATSVTADTSLLLADIGTVAAAGSTIGDAGAISKKVTLVTAADGTKGVVLPAAAAGSVYFIGNAAGSALKVYPAVNSAIDGLAANTGISIAANKGAVLIGYNSTHWIAAYA